MFIPKFDIYDTEWLDVVFKDRNKSYGAYDLRKHYTKTLFKSMAIAAVIILIVFLAASLQSKPKVIAPVKSTDPVVYVDLSKEITVERTIDHPTIAKHQHNGRVMGVSAVNPQTQIPPRPAKPSDNVSNPTIEGGTTTNPAQAPLNQAAAAANQPLEEADVMPQPNGGKTGLQKFLEDNLQYPAAAAAKNLSGKVWLSFIVEKDGSLTSVHVSQGAGNGFDEEAERVLKLAPHWVPGQQNGQPVRVRYSIPITFRIVK